MTGETTPKEHLITRGTITINQSSDLEHHRKLDITWQRAPGLMGWISTTNHKDIAIRYIITAFVFFVLAGILALLMRLQLALPQLHIFGPDLYNQFFTVHGTTMMFLFAVPVMEALALYFVPLMIGTRNVAFPRLNAFGYYTYLFGGVLLYVGLFLNSGPDAGWFAYVPLSGPEFSPGKRVDFWAQMITLTEIAALVSAVEVIATVFKQRCMGMALHRIPLFVWAMLVTAWMTIFAMPAVMLASGMLATDRLTNVNTHFFNPAEGGDALLYQHIFWFFGHPEVYLIFIPGTGLISTILPTFARRPVYGYVALVLSLIAIAFIGFGLWVHHMFATTIPLTGRSFFTPASMMIAVPSGVQIFCWIATLWGGRLRFASPMLYVCAFLSLFVLGGFSGVMLASVAIDTQVHDTYFVVAHFHYVLIGGAVFPLIGAVHYWFPKWTGHMLDERLARKAFWLLFIGFNLTFFPMHQLGLRGMTRRIYTYLPETGWGSLNFLATSGAGLMGVALLLTFFNILRSRRKGLAAGDNPWDAATLEWATNSPAPSYNFLYLPTVGGPNPLWEHAQISPVIVGLDSEKRHVLTTTLLEAYPDHIYELSTDSIWPFVLAIVTGGSITWLIFNPWAFPVGMAAAAVVLILWFWRENEPENITSDARKKPGPLEFPQAIPGSSIR